MPPSDITEPLSLPVVPPIPPRCQGKPALPASSPCAKRQTRSVLFNERISRKAHENTAVPAMSSLLPVKPTVPLIVDGKDVVGARSDHVYKDDSDKDDLVGNWHFQGADINLCRAAVESSAKAYPAWAATPPTERRRLFLKLAQVVREHGETIKATIENEIHATKLWSTINLEDSIGMIEEAAALATSNVLNGTIPPIRDAHAQALVFTEPLGVVLGIVPWNAPLILGFRAVVAAVVAGNTAILKGSELSPRTHYIVAKAFQEAGFPAGVVNLILHRPRDAAATFEQLITHPAVRKCNFTGSTAVGRQIASRAALALKPVLLELGGKNFSVVLEDADLDQAAKATLEGAFLNSGQICMSTDLCLVVRSVADEFQAKVKSAFPKAAQQVRNVISSTSWAKLESLVTDAREKGARILQADQPKHHPTHYPATVIERLKPNMDFYSTESFGPLLGITVVEDLHEALQVVDGCSYGLSISIFTKNHFAALKVARQVKVGAVHINSSTVHDEPTLPHGGHGESGWGRFGASWGLAEFVHTKTVVVHE